MSLFFLRKVSVLLYEIKFLRYDALKIGRDFLDTISGQRIYFMHS